MRYLALLLLILSTGCALQARDEAVKVGGYALTKLYDRLDARAQFDQEYLNSARAECDTWKRAADFSELECMQDGATSACLEIAATKHGLAATCYLSKKPKIGLSDMVKDIRDFRALLREEYAAVHLNGPKRLRRGGSRYFRGIDTMVRSSLLINRFSDFATRNDGKSPSCSSAARLRSCRPPVTGPKPRGPYKKCKENA